MAECLLKVNTRDGQAVAALKSRSARAQFGRDLGHGGVVGHQHDNAVRFLAAAGQNLTHGGKFATRHTDSRRLGWWA